MSKPVSLPVRSTVTSVIILSFRDRLRRVGRSLQVSCRSTPYRASSASTPSASWSAETPPSSAGRSSIGWASSADSSVRKVSNAASSISSSLSVLRPDYRLVANRKRGRLRCPQRGSAPRSRHGGAREETTQRNVPSLRLMQRSRSSSYDREDLIGELISEGAFFRSPQSRRGRGPCCLRNVP
jgi:hypothetical protein